ncbi:MAG: VPLPA-CTERM sorting domain-containing protein [Acidobacteriia bacterium]|nr:VPLPA-CTERM sorting domain-containing protein [Terriglobia bacterium]
MHITRVLITAIITVTLFASASFGSAIVSGFDSTSDGRNDDGTYSPGGCNNPADGGDCLATAVQVPIGLNINYYGTSFNSLYINTNGNVSLDAPFPYVSGLLQSPIGLLASFNEIIAPFFADVDTRNQASGVVSFGTGTFDGFTAFGVNWLNVGYFNDNVDKLDNFQMLLVDRSDTGAGNFDLIFNYGSMQWETGDADFGMDGLGGFSAIVGFTDGTGNPADTLELPGSSIPGSFIDGGTNALDVNSLNSNVPGRYIFDFRDGAYVVTPEPRMSALLGALMLVLLLFQRIPRFYGAFRARVQAKPGQMPS